MTEKQKMEIDILTWASEPKNWIAIVISTPLALVALLVAIKNYQRKSGILIHGIFQRCSSIDCNDSFVRSVILENMKDRAATIYKIYIKVGHNYYIEIEDHEEKPLILKPFETYTSTLGEILFHSVNMEKIRMNDLLQNDKIKKRIVLSTSVGKYTIPKPIKRWSPLNEFFNNYFTGIIKPISAVHKGQYVGENIRYIIDFKYKDSDPTSILVREDDHCYRRFNKLVFTKESLESKESLENFLSEQKAKGALHLDTTFSVYDFNEHKARINKDFPSQIKNAEKYSFYRYHILGRLYTLYTNIDTWNSNRKLQLRNKPTKPTKPRKESKQ